MLSKMLCPIRDQKTPEVLLDYVSRRLSPEMAAVLETHAADCEACQTFLAEQSAVWAAMDGFDAPSVSGDFDQRLYARIAREDQEPWWKRVWQRLAVAGEPANWRPAAALSAACVATLAVVLIQAPARKIEAPVSAPATAEKTAGVRETPDIELMERVLDDLEMLEALSPASPVL